MKTYEMIAEADENRETYITGSMRYQRDKGFHDDRGLEWPVYAFDCKNGLSDFIHIDNWEKIEPKEFTVKDMERLLGYKIKIINQLET